MSGLTARQADLLAFLVSYDRETGVAPTCREMAEAMGIVASNIIRLLHGLEERGYIRRLNRRARAIEIIRVGPKASRAAVPGPAVLARMSDEDLAQLGIDIENERFGRLRTAAIARANALTAVAQ